MKIIYFDLCAIPLFLMILYICYARKMTRGSANQLFIFLVSLSLVSTLADLGMETLDNMVPLSEAGRLTVSILAYVYLSMRNASTVVMLLFLLALTRTIFLIKRRWIRFVFFAPYVCLLILLAQNPLTHTVFTVSKETGYARGPLILIIYIIALTYGFTGLFYSIYCRRYLPDNKWLSLLYIYLLAHLAVIIQFFHPGILVEMFFTAMGEVMIMLSVMRPEERMDSEVGMLSWNSYQTDIRNIVRSGERVQIMVIRMQNSKEIRNYLGDHKYNIYISEIAEGLRQIPWKHSHHMELYFERPGTIYMIVDEDETAMEKVRERLLSKTGVPIIRYAQTGVRFEPQVCQVFCPDDLKKAEDIISLGHTFYKIDNHVQSTFRAKEIVDSKNFAIEAHIKEILDRSIRENNLEIYYQPIYDVRSGSFRSAEALARIIDPEYGLISPGIFIPAAETQGYIIPIGDVVMDHVFRFVSEHDMDVLGLACIEINLSIAQCMDSSLPEKIHKLQQKYKVNPGRINLEITETTFENISEIVLENIDELIRMGYSFSLDDYGIGYSSIQRINHIPLKMIKLDKSMLDEASCGNGRLILEHTVRMMQSIGKKLVAEGAETTDVVELLKDMNCDYIQGFYFSKPLCEDHFISFLEEQNNRKIS